MSYHQLSNGVQILRQLSDIKSWQDTLLWQPFREGVDIFRLYGDGLYGPTAALLRYREGAAVLQHEHLGYEHILVLSGSQTDENGRMETGTLVVNPPGTKHSIVSEKGCIVLAIYEKPVKFQESPSP